MSAKIKYTVDQQIVISAAATFLIGGVFMLINAFAGLEWAFWLGLGLSVAATSLFVTAWFMHKKRMEDGTKTSAVHPDDAHKKPIANKIEEIGEPKPEDTEL